MQIDGLRGWRGEEIRFEFPVAVVCGENGSGKSTILKAAAAAYRNPLDGGRTFYPSTFFPDTPWEQVENASLTYKLKEGANDRMFVARKRTQRWRFQKNRPRRHVILQDVSRTLPLDATAGYAYIAKRTAQEVSAEDLSAELIRYYSAIMGRTYAAARFALSNADAHRKVGVVKCGDLEFSQFHQGAGEDATLDLMSLLTAVQNNLGIVGRSALRR